MATKTARDYPVKYKFGYSAAYGGWHSGCDRGTPYGTPLIVNKTKLGYTGNTGYVIPAPTISNPKAGAHLHITKLSNSGTFMNPGNEGFTFYRGVPGARPRVLATGKDSRNGRWVKVRNWNRTRIYVYCHLSKVTCKAGDRIL